MMYYKEIEGRIIFSSCKAIHTQEGWISNPTPEQIAANGWEVYVPPVVPPTPQTEPDMYDVMEAVKKMLSTDTEALSDEDALDVAALFPTWSSKVGEAVTTGERLWDDGFLWKVLQPHTPQADWRPADTPALWKRVSVEEWPEWIQPVGSEDAYHKDDKTSHNGFHWISDVDNNVWEPGVAMWTRVE